MTIRLNQFEGPLDLLLYLIQSHEMDISTISIGKVTDQYLTYVKLMQELNFDIASEFLVIAATLILWKSKALLPPEDGELSAMGSEDDLILTPEDLLRQLLEHQRFLAAGEDLAQQPQLGTEVFTRPNRRPPIERVWREMSITDLGLGYQDMLVRARKRNQVLRKETVSVAEKIYYFADHLEVGKPKNLRDLVSLLGSRPELVVTFLASLELSRLKKLRLYQDLTYAPIYLELLENIQGMKLGLQTDFDKPFVDQVEGNLAEPAPQASAEETVPPELAPSPVESIAN
jgi:segregation and condensation protein A